MTPDNHFAKYKLITEQFLQELDQVLSVKRISNISILVAFITKSGAQALIDRFHNLTTLQGPLRIITGTYLDFTHPTALKLLLNERNISLRIIDSSNYNLHAKAFFLDLESGEGIIYIGSSNLTSSALTQNIEWNVKLSSFVEPNDYTKTKMHFERLWAIAEEIDEYWLESYSKRFNYSNLYFREREEEFLMRDVPTPRYAQNEALVELDRTRRLGYNKALIVLATGLGKTHLAAFDSRDYHKILFIAHSHEILRQAERIFQQVRPYSTTGQLSDGWHTRTMCDVLFATIQKISRRGTLERFHVNEFDYIIIDEFHHGWLASLIYYSIFNATINHEQQGLIGVKNLLLEGQVVKM